MSIEAFKFSPPLWCRLWNFLTTHFSHSENQKIFWTLLLPCLKNVIQFNEPEKIHPHYEKSSKSGKSNDVCQGLRRRDATTSTLLAKVELNVPRNGNYETVLSEKDITRAVREIGRGYRIVYSIFYFISPQLNAEPKCKYSNVRYNLFHTAGIFFDFLNFQIWRVCNAVELHEFIVLNTGSFLALILIPVIRLLSERKVPFFG